MTDFAVGQEAQVAAVRDADAARVGLPMRAVRSTPGHHAPPSPEPGTPGWSTHVHGLRRHADGRAAYQVPNDASERAALASMLKGPGAALVMAADKLPDDWNPPGLDVAAAQVKEQETR